MGNVVSVDTSRWLAPLCWTYNFACNNYGLLSTPNMKDINDKIVSFYSPYPAFIGGFFFPQQILELWYLRELFRPAKDVSTAIRSYVSLFSLGNVAIGTWLFFWNSEKMHLANICVMINSFTNLYWVYTQRIKDPKTTQEKLTNAVAMSFAGVGLLDLLHNGSVAYYPNYNTAPPFGLQAITLAAFPILAYFSPVLMGAFFTYDQIGIAFGQYSAAQRGGIATRVAAQLGNGGGGGTEWAMRMGIGAAVTAAATGLRYAQTGKWLD